MKFRKPFRPKTRRLRPAKIAGDCGSSFHNQVLLLDRQPVTASINIDVNIVDEVYYDGFRFL